jgi:hypothetical protein
VILALEQLGVEGLAALDPGELDGAQRVAGLLAGQTRLLGLTGQ